MDDKKRNFTNYDEEIILSILSENIETMKFRGNKGWIVAAKDKVYETISHKFGEDPLVSNKRTSAEIKKKVENMKGLAKRSLIDLKRFSRNTGGGPPKNACDKLGIDSRILNLIEDDAQPVHNEFDSDTKHHGDEVIKLNENGKRMKNTKASSTITSSNGQSSETNKDDPIFMDDFIHKPYSPTNLSAKKRKRSSSKNEVEIYETSNACVEFMNKLEIEKQTLSKELENAKLKEEYYKNKISALNEVTEYKKYYYHLKTKALEHQLNASNPPNPVVNYSGHLSSYNF